MQEDDLRASSNVEDRRGMSGGTAAGGLGIGVIVVLSLIGWATGIDPRVLIGGAGAVADNGVSHWSARGVQHVQELRA